MAAASYGITTGGVNLVLLKRKVQGTLWKGYNSACRERAWHTKLDRFTLAASQREVTTPIDIRRNYGGASIVEGGYEAMPVTVAPNELTFTYIHENYRYTFSRTSELLGTQGTRAEVFSQEKYQARKQLEAMCERYSFGFYGFSTGLVCLTSTNATQSSGNYTLIDLYGKSSLDSGTLIGQIIKPGTRVALRRSGNLVANAIGTVTAYTPSTGVAAITWIGSVDSDAGDEVILAGSQENTTLAGGTDHNKWTVGLLDIAESSSLHGLATSAEPLWAAGTDSNGGRMNFVKWKQAQNFVKNNGGGDIDTVILDQAVEADMTDALLGTNRYGTTIGMQLDGETAIRGVKTIEGTRWTPTGYAWLYDSASIKRWEPAGQFPDEDGNLPDSNSNLVITDKLENLSAKATGVDYIHARVCNNRGNVFQFSGLQGAY